MPGGLEKTSVPDPNAEWLEGSDALSDEFYDTVLNSMSEGVLVYDADGRIVACNPAAEGILGLTGRQIRGGGADGESWQTIREDGTPYPRSDQPSVLTRLTGRPQRGVVMGVDRAGRQPTWIRVNSEPILRDGEVRAVVVSFTDVTRTMAAARELRRRNRELILLNRIIATCAAAEEDDDLLATVCTQLEGKLGLESVTVVVRDKVPAGQGVAAEGDDPPAFRPDQRSVEFVPLSVPGREPMALRLSAGSDNVVGSTRMRTVRMVVEQVESTLTRLLLSQQRREAQKMEALGRLAGGIAHDFNNLLTAIQGHAALGLTSANGDEGTRVHFDGIRETGRRAAHLTGKLLTFVRGRVASTEVLQVEERLREMSELLRRLVPEHVKLVFRLGGGDAWIRADPTDFEQIIINLVINAADAMPDGGRLDLQTETREEHGSSWVVLKVLDEGVGIQPSSLPDIFKPLFTTKDQDRGTGLGLATVQSIVQAGGGRIEVDSRVGVGTTFEVLLPRAESPGSGGGEALVGDLPSGDGRTVLLVEDDVHLRPILLRAFKDAGYAVLAAAGDGEAALRAMNDMEHMEIDLDLIVSDVVLPRLDGPSVVDTLRVRYPALAAILMSGYPGGVARRFRDLPPRTAFLEKPFEPVELLRLASRLVAIPMATDSCEDS